MILSAKACDPLIDTIIEEIRFGPVVNMDEITVQVMHEPDRANASTSCMKKGLFRRVPFQAGMGVLTVAATFVAPADQRRHPWPHIRPEGPFGPLSGPDMSPGRAQSGRDGPFFPSPSLAAFPEPFRQAAFHPPPTALYRETRLSRTVASDSLNDCSAPYSEGSMTRTSRKVVSPLEYRVWARARASW